MLKLSYKFRILGECREYRYRYFKNSPPPLYFCSDFSSYYKKFRDLLKRESYYHFDPSGVENGKNI